MGKRGLLGCVSICLVLCLMQPVAVCGASVQALQQQIHSLKEEAAALKEEQAQLEGKLTENLGQTEELLTQKHIIDQQITLLYGQIRNAEAQITARNGLIADRQEELDGAQASLEQMRQASKTRIRAMEEAGRLTYWSVIFEASSFTDLLDRMNMIREIAQADRQRLERLTQAAQAVEEAKAALEQEKEGLLASQQELRLQQDRLTEKRTESEALLRNLVSQGQDFEAMLEAAEAQEQALMEQLAQTEAALDEAKYQQWLESYVPPATEETPPDTGTAAGWMKPVQGYKLTSPFGMRTHPITGQYRMHNGVDLACPEGTAIYAAKGGQVTVAGWNDSAGNYVQIDHGGGWRSIYMHMVRFVVSAGQYVAQGQVIGYVGDTGVSKGNHLHFGISRNGGYVNPMEYIS